eukprot:jgi/Botrbrau1/18133/Bobra.53_1s0010.2
MSRVFLTSSYILYLRLVTGSEEDAAASNSTGVHDDPDQARTRMQQGLVIAPTGININPIGLAIGSRGPFSPTGINIQPIGVAVGSAAVVNSPTGVNIQPIGVAVGASGFQNAPTGVNVMPIGHRVGSSDSADVASEPDLDQRQSQEP